MVRLTITSTILQALEELQHRGHVPEAQGEPSLKQPAIGNPITHGQIINLSKTLKEIKKNTNGDNEEDKVPYHLDDLLRGSKVYVEPPKPKAEPVDFTYVLLPRALVLTWPRPQSTRP